MKKQKGCEGVWDMVSCLCLGRRGGTGCSPIMEEGLWAAGSPKGVGKEELSSQEISVEQEMETRDGSSGLLQRTQSMEPAPLLSHISDDNFTNYAKSLSTERGTLIFHIHYSECRSLNQCIMSLLSIAPKTGVTFCWIAHKTFWHNAAFLFQPFG